MACDISTWGGEWGGGTFPMLIHIKYLKAVDGLLVMKADNRVHPDNPYIFASTQGSMSFPQGSHQFDAVVSQVDGLDHPDLLRATKICLHTKSYFVGIMELEHTTRETFFNHMSHDPEIYEQVSWFDLTFHSKL